jgi:hypothetical protein
MKTSFATTARNSFCNDCATAARHVKIASARVLPSRRIVNSVRILGWQQKFGPNCGHRRHKRRLGRFGYMTSKTLNICGLILSFVGGLMLFIDSWRISSRFQGDALEIGFPPIWHTWLTRCAERRVVKVGFPLRKGCQKRQPVRYNSQE